MLELHAADQSHHLKRRKLPIARAAHTCGDTDNLCLTHRLRRATHAYITRRGVKRDNDFVDVGRAKEPRLVLELAVESGRRSKRRDARSTAR